MSVKTLQAIQTIFTGACSYYCFFLISIVSDIFRSCRFYVSVLLFASPVLMNISLPVSLTEQTSPVFTSQTGKFVFHNIISKFPAAVFIYNPFVIHAAWPSVKAAIGYAAVTKLPDQYSGSIRKAKHSL